MDTLTYIVEADYLRKRVRQLESALRDIEDSVPQVWDGAHLVDCPYIDVLRSIRTKAHEALDEE